jgi:uncharacterized membrane protein YdbT with pleckstrin-like domain
MPAAASAPSYAAAETTVWEGTPSQWTNVVPFLLCVLIIPIPYAIYRWLDVKTTRFTLTSQRFRAQSGILSKRFDDLELYRVKDSTLTQPFIQRLVGLGTVTLMTSDASTPTVVLPAIADPLKVHDTIRREVERVRRERGVRELDVHDDDGSAIR